MGDDDVGVALGRLHILLVHGLDRVLPLVNDAADAASPFLQVTEHPACQTHIGIRVHEHLQVHQRAQLRLGKDEDALQQNHRLRY